MMLLAVGVVPKLSTDRNGMVDIDKPYYSALQVANSETGIIQKSVKESGFLI